MTAWDALSLSALTAAWSALSVGCSFVNFLPATPCAVTGVPRLRLRPPALAPAAALLPRDQF